MTRTFKTLAIIAAVTSLTACGSLGGFNSNPDQQIRNQKLQTSFNDGLKIETNCSWYKGDEACEFVSFEATASAPTLGGTNANGYNAKLLAEARAKAMIIHHLNEKVNSSIITSTVSKNIEKAKDRISTNSGGQDDEAVTMTEDEAKTSKVKPGDNVSYRENNNNAAFNVNHVIKQYATSNLQGCTTKFNQSGPQEVTAIVFCSRKNQITAKKAYATYNAGK